MTSPTLLLLACGAALAAADPAASFEDAAPGALPPGWQAAAWSAPAPAAGAVQVVEAAGAAHGGQVLRVAAPAAGAVGASAAALPVAPGDPTRRFRVQVRAAPGSAGVRPWAFLGCWAGNRFLGRVDFKTPLATGASWALISGGVRPDQLPAGTERIQLNLAAQADGKIAAAGALEFDDLRISEDPAEFRLDGATPGNWLAAGEALVLRPAGGRLPAAVAALETVARDSDSREVARFATPRAQVEAEGLRWTPPAAGLYELALTCVLADGTRTPQVERWPARKPDGSLAECERAAIACAVAAAPTRTAAARWGVLGVSYGGDDGDDILELADRLGVAFVRYHWIPWGWAWNPAAIVEPEPGRYQWQHLDGRFAAIRGRGLEIIGNVISTPRWASPHPEQEEIAICIKKWSTYAPTDLTRWTGFLDTLVKRYPFVRTWELWNEPHLPGGSVFWHDSPEAFARLLASGYLAVKAADPQTTVWIGGLGGRRYLPFYKELLRLGGGAPYDVLALHGTWCDPAPFRALDRTAGLRERAWVNSEYHATLVRHDPQGIPDERAIARRMYLDLLSQVALGAERIALFETANHTEREALPHAQDGIVDGLYRRRPRLEPRLAAVVVQRLSTLFGSQVVPGAQAVLGDQRAALFRSDGRPLLLYWSDAATASAPAPQLAAALAGARLSDWEGRPLPPGHPLQPGTCYWAEDAAGAEAALAPHAARALVSDRARRLAAAAPTTGAATRDAAPPQWNEQGWRFVGLGGAQRPAGFDARFACAWRDGRLELTVEVHDRVHRAHDKPNDYWQGDSVQVGLDALGDGVPNEQVQLQVALTPAGPVLWKEGTPYIGGDLPQGWTPARKPVANGAVAIEPLADGGGLVYRIAIAGSELYPWRFDPAQPLRLSLLVNDNDGDGRLGWLEWGGGIGGETDPGQYGRVEWR